MPEFDKIEDTLYVPMLGRIYCSEHFPHILMDKKALELKDKLPKEVKGQDTQTQYTLMAGAVRSTNIDRTIQDFMKRHEDGVLVMLGAGLETTFYRNNNDKNQWYEIDLPNVIEYRKELLGENPLDEPIAMDAFSEDWIKYIRGKYPTNPIMVVASALFYYFEDNKVLNLFKTLKTYGNVEVVFDTVNKAGMKQMSRYMKQVGHEDATMYFCVDKADVLKEQINAASIVEDAYYKFTPKKGFSIITKLTMKISDLLMMVKMEHIYLN